MSSCKEKLNFLFGLSVIISFYSCILYNVIIYFPWLIIVIPQFIFVLNIVVVLFLLTKRKRESILQYPFKNQIETEKKSVGFLFFKAPLYHTLFIYGLLILFILGPFFILKLLITNIQIKNNAEIVNNIWERFIDRKLMRIYRLAIKNTLEIYDLHRLAMLFGLWICTLVYVGVIDTIIDLDTYFEMIYHPIRQLFFPIKTLLMYNPITENKPISFIQMDLFFSCFLFVIPSIILMISLIFFVKKKDPDNSFW